MRGGLVFVVLGLALLSACVQQPPRDTGSKVTLVEALRLGLIGYCQGTRTITRLRDTNCYEVNR